ncbi:MAG: DUF3991 and TOPRIM domain-containing protein [Ruminococcus sp.]|nr:DUF3991 and TOPRIM domain-containing protein [Ruminococcus sp.]
MPYIPYTDEQKQLANSVDLPTFLRMRGEKLVPVGREFKLVYHDGYGKHDSITISGSQWYDHKNQIGGGPIKFMREHYGMNFQEAMQALLGHSALPLTHEVPPVMAKEKKEFRLPDPNDNMHRVYAYLIKQRFIAPEVITHFAKRKLLYEDKKHHNAVFVGVDSNGIPRQAHKRSTTTFGNSFRQTIEGSDTRYSFAHFGKSNMLFVFEAPIDMLSFISMNPNSGWENDSYIAMNGVYESAVLTALEEHPNIDWVVICTDNDEGGIDAAHRLWDILNELDYDLTIYPPNNKDYNEDLKEERGAPFIPAVPHKRLEEYEKQAESLQYYPCRIEKLRSQLNAAFQNGQYKYLAEYALAGSVFFSQKTGSKQDADREFRHSAERLAAFYRPYHDRSKSVSLRRELGEKVADVMQDLKNYARTEEQTIATADKLYDLADYALRVSVDEVLRNQEQTQEEEIEPEPDFEMQLE